MNFLSLTRAACFLAMTSLLVLSMPVAQGHPCENHKNPNHKHCAGPTDRIPGCVTFTSGPITAVGERTYCDGDATTNYQNAAHSMQVAMNFSSNWFKLDPGGGDRRIGLSVNLAIDTGFTSCKDLGTVSFSDTDDAVMNSINCTNTDPDWAFLQHMRASASGGENVCELADGQSMQATMRFQSHLYHLKACKGGAKKCGTFMEELEVNYDGGSCSDVTVPCNAPVGGGQCTTWTVASAGPGCLTHGPAGTSVPQTLPFKITFEAI